MQGLDSQDQGFGQYYESSDEGQTAGSAGVEGVETVRAALDAPVGTAHGQTEVIAASNQDAFDDRLSAVSEPWLFRALISP